MKSGPPATEQRPISALDESWQLFDASVQLSLHEKDYPRAFALSEAARAQIGERIESLRQRESSSRFRRRSDPDEAIVALNQFETELAVWVIKRNGIDVIDARDVSRHAPRDSSHASSMKSGSRRQSRAPGGSSTTRSCDRWRPSYSGISRLVIVPDSTFQDAAFAAFYNSEKRRYLIEDVSVRLAPSAAAFAMSASLAGRGGTVMRAADFRRLGQPRGVDCVRLSLEQRPDWPRRDRGAVLRRRRRPPHRAHRGTDIGESKLSVAVAVARRRRARDASTGGDPRQRDRATHHAAHQPGGDRRSRGEHPIEARAR